MTLGEYLASAPADEYLYIGTGESGGWCYIGLPAGAPAKLEELGESWYKSAETTAQKLRASIKSIESGEMEEVLRAKIETAQMPTKTGTKRRGWTADAKKLQWRIDHLSEQLSLAKARLRELEEYLQAYRPPLERGVTETYPRATWLPGMEPAGTCVTVPGPNAKNLEFGGCWTLDEYQKGVVGDDE